MTIPLLILGVGASGRAAARLAAAEGICGIVVSEQKPTDEILKSLADLGFSWQAVLPESAVLQAVVSPGIPGNHPWLQSLAERGVDVLPEFEWAAARLQGIQIAVTGSLGKTSVVLLAADLLRNAGYGVEVSGNIGAPVSEIALEAAVADFHILELSSFQLELSQRYRPNRALCLNLFPNHLDRHPDLQNYAAAKARLFRGQTEADLAIWPEDFPVEVVTRSRRVHAEDISFPELGNTPFRASALRKNLQGLFAVLQGIPGVDAFRQQTVLRDFRFPPHRMQVLEISGAGKVMDDSKSTCLNATLAAMSSVQGEMQLVMGGLDKGESLDVMLPMLRERNPSVYLFGRAAKKMAMAWQDTIDECRTYDSLDELLPVLWKARTHAQTLLFSPGCASFDQFSGYAERGRHFQQLVSQLAADFPIKRTAVKETL